MKSVQFLKLFTQYSNFYFTRQKKVRHTCSFETATKIATSMRHRFSVTHYSSRDLNWSPCTSCQRRSPEISSVASAGGHFLLAQPRAPAREWQCCTERTAQEKYLHLAFVFFPKEIRFPNLIAIFELG